MDLDLFCSLQPVLVLRFYYYNAFSSSSPMFFHVLLGCGLCGDNGRQLRNGLDAKALALVLFCHHCGDIAVVGVGNFWNFTLPQMYLN